MRIDKTTTLAEFITFTNSFEVDDNLLTDLLKRLEDYPLNDMFDKDINDLSFAELDQLRTRIKTFDDLIYVSFEILYNLNREDVLSFSAFDCFRLALYVKTKIEEITKLFNALEHKPTADEEKAGIHKINHGLFGTIDWYAKRMGIQDHEIAENTKWVRIYKCLKIDYDNNKFARDYRRVIEQKNKLK